MLTIIGYLAAVMMGGVLGLMGGGGSILTVPILIYLFGLSPLVATGYSLLIVGLSALLGVVTHWRNGKVEVRKGLSFALPAMLGVTLMRSWILPALPEVIWHSGALQLSRDQLILGLFALAMLLAAKSMIAPGAAKEKEVQTTQEAQLPQLLGLGFATGLFAGLVGAGGGFIIVPVLMAFAGMSIHQAIGTSLLIISLQSLSGFGASLMVHPQVNWLLLVSFSALAAVGVQLGSRLAEKVPASRLKPAFGWFVLAMGCFILINTSLGKAKTAKAPAAPVATEAVQSK